MDQIELLGIVDQQWSSAKPANRIDVLQATRKLVPDELLDFYDALVDSKLANIKDDIDVNIVFLVHGIQTDAAWQNLVIREFKAIPKTSVIGIGYEFYNAAQLFSPHRDGPIDKVQREIRDAKSLSPNARLIVVAHSFGTYIVSKILSKSSDIRFYRIVLCGSIIPRDFRWDVFSPGLDSKSIINDVGTNDNWPVVATAASLGYGASGRLGFQTGRVHDRYFPYEHSDFFTQNHIRKFWMPFVENGTIVRSEWDIKRPKSGFLLGIFSNANQSKILITVIVLIISSIIYSMYRLVYSFL